MQNSILKISRFCTDDGPGIRTTVFLKGCPLHCKWCHNPESQNSNPEIFFNPAKCVQCGRCVSICEQNCHSIQSKTHLFQRKNCKGNGDCANACPTGALEKIGEYTSVEEILKEIKKDVIFYQTSGGGVTVSGGEPLHQAQFTTEILKACKKENIHTAIETSGFASENKFLQVIRHCDLVLFDLKDTNEKRHQQNVGVSLSPILKNLKLLDNAGIAYVLRIPIIPTLNDDIEHLSSVKSLAKTLNNCQGIEVMPYHTLGNYKYEFLGKICEVEKIPNPEKTKLEEWKTFFQDSIAKL